MSSHDNADPPAGDAIPDALLSGGGEQPTATTSTKSKDSPFDFDVDFSQVQKRRERAKAAREAEKEEAAQAILAGMDAVDPLETSASGRAAATAQEAPTGPRRPRLIHQRARTTGSDVPSGTATAAAGGGGGRGFFSAFRGGAGAEASNVDIIPEDQVEDREPFQIGNKRVALWPFDDYHLVQKLYYTKLEEQKTEGGGGTSSSSPRGANANTAAATNLEEAAAAADQQQSSIPIFSRPADPPDIPTAVQGLSLTEFERAAEERSIAIVSTWLFDAGLIDELLVNGGMTNMTLSDSAFHSATTSAGSTLLGGNAMDSDNRSVQTSEGVEVGSHGFPIEGSTKMDKEIAKLRNSTKRQLALINARLNDGVAATGSEVQELVNAVIATKDDIGRLRELSTYVSNAGDVEQTSQFMLTKYPKLKQAINARRNLARCFRELDFFSQIPATCDRLREELHAGEWTAHEWSTIRSVCREHVELEIFLVEAEAGMKQRLEDEPEDHADDKNKGARSSNATSSRRKERDIFGKKSFANSGLGGNNDDLIDRFLEEHVGNVWELGDEIRMRIMSGIASAFDLAMNNPAGMVALVEAVEVYESANDEFRVVHGEEAGKTGKQGTQTLRFSAMRPAALGELYKDFENRGLTVFRELTMQAADVAADEDEASNQQFSAVLRAANELTSEIGIVKEQMAPCFPPNWEIETLWTSCVAHVCSTNILQQIGGPDGQKLPDLTVTQLLDLVAWVETFREIIEETFPNITEVTAKKTYFDRPPKLLSDDSKTVDIELAKDSLAWVQNTLWDVHDLAKDEFLFRTKEQTEEWLGNVYDADHTNTQTTEGRLVTSLCEDVYALAGVQLRTIRDRLTRKSEAMVQAVGVIFKNLYEKQISARENFCTDFETCCAAANDFIRMSEKCEEIIEEIMSESQLSRLSTETLEEQSAAILGLYSGDAVYAAQKTHVYCFEPIYEAISDEIFGPDWEKNLTHNELALTIVRTLDDFMEDLETFLDELMVQKAVEAQIASSVNCYIKLLMAKASAHNSNRASAFENNEVAMNRMRGDVAVMRDYFDGLAESMPRLSRVIETEFATLEAVLEIVAIAAGLSSSDIQDFVLVLQKSVKNVTFTKFAVGDLYHLVSPGDEKKMYDQLDTMEEEMVAVAPTDEKAVTTAMARSTVPGLRLDQVLARQFDESKRKRHLAKAAIQAGDQELETWRATWEEPEESE